jgi:hypothetical protein
VSPNALDFPFLVLTFRFCPSTFIFLSVSSYFALGNFPFLLLTFRFGIHQHAKIRSDPKGKKMWSSRWPPELKGENFMNLSVETKVAIAVATSFVVLMVGAMAQG